jgi:hypothetical protein
MIPGDVEIEGGNTADPLEKTAFETDQREEEEVNGTD